MTGAVLPVGCDCVVPVEQLTVADGVARSTRCARVAPWRNIHRRGSDAARARCCCGRHPAAARRRSRWRPRPAWRACASAASRRSWWSRPAMSWSSRAIRSPGTRSAARTPMRVAAALRERGFQRVADDHVPTMTRMLRERLALHLPTHEVLILSGGVSMGRFDLVPRCSRSWACSGCFHNIAQRPGKPMWFGVATAGPGRVRTARQSGLDAGMPDPLCRARLLAAMGARREPPSAWRSRRRSRGSRR